MDNDNKLFKNKKERTDIIIAAVVILFAGAFIFSKIYKGLPKFEKSDKQIVIENVYEIEDTTEEIVNTANITEEVEQEIFNDFEEGGVVAENDKRIPRIRPLSRIIRPKTSIRSDIKRHKNPEGHAMHIEKRDSIKKEFIEKNENTIIEEVVVEDKIIEVEEVITEETVINTESQQGEFEEHIEESITEVKTEVVETEVISDYKEEKKEEIVEEQINTTVNKINSIDDGLSDCTIVVGVFQESVNKDKTIEKLTSLGYSHSEGLMRNGLTYVGVPVTCANKTASQKLINELNAAFNVNTWVRKN